MSMHKFGVCNTVATSGTALTPEQIQLLGRFTHRVILVYDADAAGLKASLVNCEAFLRAGFQVSAVPLPEGKDPDNIAQEQKLETGKWLANREQNFLQYFAISLRAHPLYKKIVGRTYKLKAHDEENACGVGDIVKVMETRPLSKDKRWRVVEIVEKAK